MKRITGLILIVFFALVTTASLSTAAELPKILKDGLEKYAKEGPKAAIEAWTKGSAVEGSKEVLSQANNFQQVQDFYGSYVGYNLVRIKEHSPTSAAYLLEIKYEKGNLFAKFFAYKKPDGTLVINTFNFHTNPEAVWPAAVVFGCEDGQ